MIKGLYTLLCKNELNTKYLNINKFESRNIILNSKIYYKYRYLSDFIKL